MWSDLAFVLAAYLVGAIPHLYILGRLKGIDLTGDLHMALWRRGGRPLGTLGFILELVKGVTPILAGRALGMDIAVIAAGGVAAVCGQMWPAFYRFDGEKGNSIGAAMALTLTPGAFGLAAIFMAGGYLIRTVPRFLEKGKSLDEKFKLGGPPSLSFPLGMGLGFLSLPFFAWWLGEPMSVVAAYGALFLLIMVRRATAGIGEDIRGGKKMDRVVLNRLLFDRAHT
jgi:glycerol-3-phosphate acyltransferase PlsY